MYDLLGQLYFPDQLTLRDSGALDRTAGAPLSLGAWSTVSWAAEQWNLAKERVKYYTTDKHSASPSGPHI